MKLIGYSLLNLTTHSEVMWKRNLPSLFEWPGGMAFLDKVGLIVPDSQNPTHRLVERWQNQDDPPVDKRFISWNTPTYDAANDRIVVDCVYIDIPPPEPDELTNSVYQAAVNHAILLTANKIVSDPAVTAENRAKLMPLYPEWEVGKAVVVADLRRYNGALYKCVQAHTTQSNGTPIDVPAFWNQIVASGSVGPWNQPLGSSDAYMLGAIVRHSGKRWTSTRSDNIWEPGTVDSGWVVYNV